MTGDSSKTHEFSGSGQTATSSFELEDGIVTIDYNHMGERNFMVDIVDIKTGEETSIINVLDDCRGKVAMNIREAKYVLNIGAGKEWEIEIEQPNYIESQFKSLPVTGERSNDGVIGPFNFDGATRFNIEADGEWNVFGYLLDLQGEEIDTLINEIGPCDVSTMFTTDDPGLIFVETIGDWHFTAENIS